MMRLALDGTPLLGPRSGVGEVVSGIAAELARRPGRRGGRVRTHAARPEGPRRRGAARRARREPDLPGAARATVVVAHGVPRVERWTGPIDVVHATNYVGPPTKAGEVVSVYDLGFVRYPEFVAADSLDYPELLRRAVRRGAWIHTTSDFVRDEVIETFSVPPERVVRIYPGIPPSRAATRPAAGRSRGAIGYVLAVGTIEPRKNLPVLVRAFDALAADDPELVLVVAGTRGWGGDAFDASVAAAHHGDRVQTPGYVSADDRRDLLVGAAVLAFPSHYEGFGFPPLEAMAAGVPVVTTYAGAVPEVVGDAAVVVAVDDADALAAALATALTDEGVRRVLVERGRGADRAFSWTDTVDQLLDLYEAVRA